MSFDVKVVPVGPLQMNSVILTTEGPGGPEAMIIDPGGDPEKLLHLVQEAGAAVTALLATHGHFDHIEGAAAIQEKVDLPLRCHPDDVFLIEQMPAIQSAYGLPTTAIPRFEPDLEGGETVTWAGHKIPVTHVPGHSPGQVMFRIPGHAIVGDCLFAGSVGRTDLPGGDFATLERSIRDHIYSLPDDTIVICGHGPDTTIGREKATNPFVPA